MTTQVLHTPKCRAKTLQREQAHKAYVERWPLACDACSATGVRTYPATQWEPPTIDACESCEGRCPRCGHRFPDWRTDESGQYEAFFDSDSTCPECAYDLENPDVMPPHPSEYGPCECEEAAMEAAFAAENW